ncbi:hypothetical protein V6N13_038318 [Hibiscus sabdariffa]|uniref:X8 domain-containing protein n=1 Tax=Hibiscus sabdariffa TaxID=183260 RepID=A0ABR2S2B3_9ROSI
MGKKKLCVPKDGVGDAKLQQNLDWSCAQGVAGCGPIQPDVVCVEPATVRSRATFAMNSYYRRKGGIESACDFSSTAQTTTKDPNRNHLKREAVGLGRHFRASSGAVQPGT